MRTLQIVVLFSNCLQNCFEKLNGQCEVKENRDFFPVLILHDLRSDLNFNEPFAR